MKIAQLEQQADSIEELLSERGISAQVTGGTVTHSQVHFLVWPRLGTFSRIRALAGELAAVLGVPECQVSRRRVFGALVTVAREVEM